MPEIEDEVRAIGGSLFVLIPGWYRKAYGLKPGDKIRIRLNGKILIEPIESIKDDSHEKIKEYEKELEAESE